MSKDEISIKLNVKYSFKPIPEKIALLHNYIGDNYLESVVKPQILLTAKNYFRNYMVNNITSSEINNFENQILKEARKKIKSKYINLETFQIIKINVQ